MTSPSLDEFPEPPADSLSHPPHSATRTPSFRATLPDGPEWAVDVPSHTIDHAPSTPASARVRDQDEAARPAPLWMTHEKTRRRCLKYMWRIKELVEWYHAQQKEEFESQEEDLRFWCDVMSARIVLAKLEDADGAPDVAQNVVADGTGARTAEGEMSDKR